jgi:diacylglycerol kinase (ATP)
MRVAAILGLGSTTKDLKRFKKTSDTLWMVGPPASCHDADAILIFGGDGTIHRHLTQLVELRLPVLVVPQGSGNDFARALKIRSGDDALRAWRKFAAGRANAKTIDLGVITPMLSEIAPDANAPPGRYFCCVGGVGLDAEVNRRANLLPRWLRANGGYVLSLPSALLQFSPMKIKIAASENGGERAFATRNHKLTMVAAFANAPAYGGGMKIAPHALLDDGKLDICVISDMNKFKLFCLFPTIYFGQHLRVPQVDYFQADRLKLETEYPLDVYADGEYICKTPIEVSVVRQALTVIVP